MEGKIGLFGRARHRRYNFSKYRFGCLDEDLLPAHLVVLLLHVDGPQDVQDALPGVAAPRGPSLLGQKSVSEKNYVDIPSSWYEDHLERASPEEEFLEFPPVGESSPSHSNVFFQSEVFNL